jgi:hypothetical protein
MLAWKTPIALIIGLGLLASGGQAEAQSRQKSGARGQGTVTACSIYGNGCRTAPVRRGRNDDEFRMPGGTWIPCRQSCKDTLRREVIDFWETQRENSGDRP